MIERDDIMTNLARYYEEEILWHYVIGNIGNGVQVRFELLDDSCAARILPGQLRRKGCTILLNERLLFDPKFCRKVEQDFSSVLPDLIITAKAMDLKAADLIALFIAHGVDAGCLDPTSGFSVRPADFNNWAGTCIIHAINSDLEEISDSFKHES